MKKVVDHSLVDSYIAKYNFPSILPSDILNDLILVEFKPGEQLCIQGEPSLFVYFLLKGKVKIYASTIEEKRLIVAFNTPFQMFGDIELIQNMDYLNSIEAVNDVHVFMIPTSKLSSWLQDTMFSSFLLKTIARKFYTKSKTLSFHLLNEVDVRLSSYLLSITNDEIGHFYKREISSKELKDISEFIGTSGRHLNRILKRFTEEGIIARFNDGIVIKDLTMLRNIAGDNIYEIQ